MASSVDKFSIEGIELVSKDPMQIFKSWYQDAKDHPDENMLPEQMTLSTVRRDGGPSSRTLLLRGLDEHGFKMYWDSRSRKSEEIDRDNRGTLVFVWFGRDAENHLSFRQVRVEGTLERLSKAEEESYFESEPMASKIRATVCHQSRVLPDRQILLDECQELWDKVKKTGCSIPRPGHFVGHRLHPNYFEFYYGSRNTINDRVRFRRDPQAHAADVGNREPLPTGVLLGDSSGFWVYERLEP